MQNVGFLMTRLLWSGLVGFSLDAAKIGTVNCSPVARFTERLITYLSPKTYLTTHLRPKTCLILKICIKTCHKSILGVN